MRSVDGRLWDVLLVGGASGTGKTRISYPLARYFNVGITEVDDFQIVLQQMTTPEVLRLPERQEPAAFTGGRWSREESGGAAVTAPSARSGEKVFRRSGRLEMSRQAISQHLNVLESAGLVITREDGRYKFHYLDTTPLRVIVERWPV